MTARQATLSLMAVMTLAGCYTPEGGWAPYTGGASTYISTEFRPCTVTVVDARTDEPFFTIEVPPGKQLTLDFKRGRGDDPILTPDLMRYRVFPIGTIGGSLTNALSVPDAASCRVDVDFRPGPEYAPAPPDKLLRTDQLADRPEWWTPQGGPIPDPTPGTSLYDDW